MHTVTHRALVVLAGCGVMIGPSSALVAQGPSPGPVAIYRIGAPIDAAWSDCLRAVPESTGLLVTAYLGIPASDSVPPALRDQVNNFAVTLDDEMRHALGSLSDTLPYVSRRTPGFMTTSAHLVVRRDGTFDWSTADTAQWSRRTRQLLLDALQARRKAGDMIVWPDEVPGDSARMRLYVSLASLVNGKLIGDEVLPLAIPVFTTRVLAEKPASVKHSVSPQYPLRNRNDGWIGTVNMQFVVDTSGRADESTIRDIWPKGAPSLRDDQRDVYAAFMKAAIEGIRGSTFYPAELAGCKVRQVVQQAFVFSIGTPR